MGNESLNEPKTLDTEVFDSAILTSARLTTIKPVVTPWQSYCWALEWERLNGNRHIGLGPRRILCANPITTIEDQSNVRSPSES